MRRRSSIFGALPNFLLVLALTSPISAQDPEPGQVSGLIVDAQTGDPLIGVVVLLKDTQYGTTTDMDGNFHLRDIPPATYELVASMIGYNQTTITGIQVQSGATTRLELTMELEVIQLEKEVIIEAKARRNTEAALLKERQKAPAVSDAISAEDISRAGSGDAADAMKHVTGASVEEGKYVVIRGLGDRYSTVQLNGAALPSSDPNKKTAAIGLFPSSLLDNIVTVKSFTPDKPGNSTGGNVNIGTKSFPESFTFSLSNSTSYNPQTTFEDNFLTYNGGKWDWLGFDDGTRELPELLNQAEIPDIGEAWSDAEKAQQLDQLSKSFSPVMNPFTEKAPLNHSYSFAVGNQIDLLDRPLGFLGTFTYSRKFSVYNQGRSGRWQLTGRVRTPAL